MLFEDFSCFKKISSSIILVAAVPATQESGGNKVIFLKEEYDFITPAEFSRVLNVHITSNLAAVPVWFSPSWLVRTSSRSSIHMTRYICLPATTGLQGCPSCAGLDSSSVSKLPFLSKILEKMVYPQLKDFLDQHKMLEVFQSRFKTFHSTESAVKYYLQHF